MLPFRFEHDDRSLFERDSGRVPSVAKNLSDGFKRVPLGLIDVGGLERVAHVELEARNGIRLVERNQRTAIPDRHQLDAGSRFSTLAGVTMMTACRP